MGKILTHILGMLFLAFLTANSSCSTGECTENQSSIPLAGFYSTTTGASVSLDSISVYGVAVPEDSMILRNQSGISQVYLPLRINASNSQFVIHYNNSVFSDPKYNDTISINYESFPYFASSECGAMYNFNVTDFSHTSQFIDSVAIPDMKFTNLDIVTIRIYIKTSYTY